MHLFDIDVKGGIRFKESEVLSAGDQLAILNLDGFKIGIGICYDIRFEELARIYRNKGTLLEIALVFVYCWLVKNKEILRL